MGWGRFGCRPRFQVQPKADRDSHLLSEKVMTPKLNSPAKVEAFRPAGLSLLSDFFFFPWGASTWGQSSLQSVPGLLRKVPFSKSQNPKTGERRRRTYTEKGNSHPRRATELAKRAGQPLAWGGRPDPAELTAAAARGPLSDGGGRRRDAEVSARGVALRSSLAGCARPGPRRGAGGGVEGGTGRGAGAPCRPVMRTPSFGFPRWALGESCNLPPYFCRGRFRVSPPLPDSRGCAEPPSRPLECVARAPPLAALKGVSREGTRCPEFGVQSPGCLKRRFPDERDFRLSGAQLQKTSGVAVAGSLCREAEAKKDKSHRGPHNQQRRRPSSSERKKSVGDGD